MFTLRELQDTVRKENEHGTSCKGIAHLIYPASESATYSRFAARLAQTRVEEIGDHAWQPFFVGKVGSQKVD